MTPSQIESFLTIVRLGSISEAARFLFISQSTISQRLQSLEKEYEVILINRSKGMSNISLTEEGENFLKIALRWEELMIEARDIKTHKTSSTLTIGAVDSVHNYMLSPFYDEIRRKYPELKLIIKTHQSYEIYSLLEHREIDIGFPLQDRVLVNFSVNKLFEEQMVLIQKKRPRDKISIIDNALLCPKDELYINWGLEFQQWHEKHWGTFGSLGIQIDTPELMMHFMQEKENWAIVPVSVARNLFRLGKVDILPLLDPPPARICYYVHRNSSEKQLSLFDECFSSSQEKIMEIVQDWSF